MSDIAEVFNDVSDESVNDASNEVPDSTESESKEKVETEQAAETPPEKQEPETTSEEKTEQQEWTFAAVKDERQKRQKLEKELEELRAQNAASEIKIPDVVEDQEGFTKHLEDKIRGESRQAIIETQRDMMMDFKPDYEEKESAFMEMAKGNAALIAEANASKNPAKFAYEQGAKYLKYQELQNVDSMEAKLRAELETKIRAELEGKIQQEAKLENNISPSLAKARGTTDKTDSVPENPADLF